VLAEFRELTAHTRADLTAQLDVLHLPPDEAILEPMRGGSFVRVPLCSVGDPDEADRLRGGGDELLLDLRENGQGYAATFDVALDTTYA